MTKPSWIRVAERYLGQKEIKGVTHNPLIVDMWKWIKRGGIKNDEVPWCAAFVGSCFEQVWIKSSRFESAKSYLDWGVKLDKPVYGAVAVFSRNGGGHVGFIVGTDKQGRLMILGGNQGDEVNIRPFESSRLTGIRWPLGVDVPKSTALPIYDGNQKSSTNEA